MAVHNSSDLVAEAAAATQAEHDLRLYDALRKYPKAIAWCMLVSMAIIMEGFDGILTAQFYALPQFKEVYGERQPDGSFEIPPAWQAGLPAASTGGCLIGIFLSGWAAERFGYRRTMMLGLVGTSGAIFLYFFAKDLPMLLAAAAVMGIPYGIYETLTAPFAAEVMPVSLRAYLTTYTNLCYVIGQLLASGAVRGTLHLPGALAFRVPYALQWIWPTPLLIGIALCPESPWWLVRHNRISDARKSLLRFVSGAQRDGQQVSQILAMMQMTVKGERVATQGGSWTDCFRGVNLRRTEICCGVFICQAFCGSAFLGYSAYLFRQVGLDEEQSFTLALLQYALGVVATLCSWITIRYYGRRTLYLTGMIALCLIMLSIGLTGLLASTHTAARWVIGGLTLLYTFVYNLSVGAICYSLMTEIPSVQLRIKTVALARSCYDLIGIFNWSITPYMLNPSAWAWGARSALFWAGLSGLCAFWIFLRLPEPKGLTYGELDVLFEHRIPTRQFKRETIDSLHTLTSLSENKTASKRSGEERS